MTAPSAPYCATADVAALLPNMIGWAADFDTATTPTKTAVTNLISKWACRVDMAFAAVGYVVPFQEVSGETWATWQTGMLLLMNALAVAGALTGPILKPAPAIGDKRGYTDNAFTAEFKDMTEKITISGLGFRAATRTGSLAEQFVNSPIGPMSDYLMGYIDETNWMTITEYTGIIERIREQYYVGYGVQQLDHMANRRRELIGI